MNAFAHTYWVAFALVGVTVLAALFLPRKPEKITGVMPASRQADAAVLPM